MTQNMTLAEYAEARRKGNIPAKIEDRWQRRVLPKELHLKGATGAELYLQQYGNNIGAKKVCHLARRAEAAASRAESEGRGEEAASCRAMAGALWAQAYKIELGVEPPAGNGAGGGGEEIEAAAEADEPALPEVPGLPAHLQPGRLVTEQPVDAPYPRLTYISSNGWWGQAKRDGQRTVLWGTEGAAFYQSRQMRLFEIPSEAIEGAVRETARQAGPFVVDGELWWRDAVGGEHRTGAQAAEWNDLNGYPGVSAVPVIAVFKGLFFQGRDLTMDTAAKRVSAGEEIGGWLVAAEPEHFEVLPTARTTAEKEALANKQRMELREGVVWFRPDRRYEGGKREGADAYIVRTKIKVEFPAVVLALKDSQAGRAFASMEVGAYVDGELRSLGAVGTGFTMAQAVEIRRRHEAQPGCVVVKVRSQRFTERGQVCHGTYEGMLDVPPEACVLAETLRVVW